MNPYCCNEYAAVRTAYAENRATIPYRSWWRFCPFCGKRWTT